MTEQTKNKEYYPVALTVAGSDSGGGAGIQADLRTFSAFGVFGCSAITAVTAQNPTKVSRIDALPPDAVTAQIETVLERIAVKITKTGMLFNAGIVDCVAAAAAKHSLFLVVDPVMIATSGAKLLEDDAITAMKDRLLVHADWITPNLPEAEVLSGIRINGRKSMIDAAKYCAAKWNCGCLLKGGHLPGKQNVAIDIVCYDNELYELCSPIVPNCRATHGTGCTLSAAFTAALALGSSWRKAMVMAKEFVYGSLNETITIGSKLDAMFPPFDKNYQGRAMLSKIEII
jgi:hydroxymethylpyrimidine/phosphomethylpyrimidine kinase